MNGVTVLDPRGALALQRTAGNRATTLCLQRSPIVVQRDEVALTGGGRVSDHDSVGVNARENVLTVMDRLRDLGAMPSADYAAESARVTAMPARAVVPVAQLGATMAALGRARLALLSAPAAETLLHLALSGGVGWGQPNNKADVAAVQDFLHAQGLVSDDAYGTVDEPGERAAVEASGATVTPMVIPQTMAALRAVKDLVLAGAP